MATKFQEFAPARDGRTPALRVKIDHGQTAGMSGYYVVTLEYAELDVATGEMTVLYDSPLEHLELRAQGDNTNPGKLYGYDATFRHVWSVDLRHAESMVRTLKAIRRGLDKAAERDGDLKSFGQYVLRVCRALGINSVIFDARNGCDIGTGKTFTVRNALDATHLLDWTLMDEWTAAEMAGQRVNSAGRRAA